MLLRCELAEALRKGMIRERLTQAQAAKRLGVVQLYYKVRPLSFSANESGVMLGTIGGVF